MAAVRSRISRDDSGSGGVPRAIRNRDLKSRCTTLKFEIANLKFEIPWVSRNGRARLNWMDTVRYATLRYATLRYDTVRHD